VESDLKGVNVFLDVDMDNGTWRWSFDFRDSDKKMLIVASDIYNMITNGVIPDELQDELTQNKNGGSPI
jgi:hypothetical protein